MILYKNGFVVADMSAENSAYNAWPLADKKNDKMAQALTDEAYNRWFAVYDMQQILPDTEYIKRYLDYCNRIHLPVKVLLFESPNGNIAIDNEPKICETLGFDCIGTVHYSYLQTEYNEFRPELLEQNIVLNPHGLLGRLEDVLFFVKLRKKVIASGINLEDFWEELPVRISVVDFQWADSTADG